MSWTYFVCPACGKCHDIDCELKDGGTVRCPETKRKYLIKLIYDARPDEADSRAWIRKATAKIMKLVQEYNDREKQDAES